MICIYNSCPHSLKHPYQQPSLNRSKTQRQHQIRNAVPALSVKTCSKFILLKVRRASNEMALGNILGILLLGNALSSVLSCGGGGGPPPPCSWTTCRHEWRNDWTPGISTGQCVNQHRNAHFITTSHSRSGSCPAPSHCSPSTQNRRMCK